MYVHTDIDVCVYMNPAPSPYFVGRLQDHQVEEDRHAHGEERVGEAEGEEEGVGGPEDCEGLALCVDGVG